MNDESRKDLALAQPTTLAIREAEIIGAAAEEDGGEKFLKFVKGEYFINKEPVALGSEYIAHCVGWTKCWIKFKDDGPPERKMYPVLEKQRILARDELDENDPSKWGPGLDGKPKDPWVFQYLLPLTNQADDLFIFVTSSFFGRRAVSNLCRLYHRRTLRTGISENPVVKLAASSEVTKKWGKVQCPLFEVVGWDGSKEAIREVNPIDTLANDMNDQIPF
jgi:hypothetical protein